eukprot:gene49304-36096_t
MDDGDALIRFDGHDEATKVPKRHFAHLDVMVRGGGIVVVLKREAGEDAAWGLDLSRQGLSSVGAVA